MSIHSSRQTNVAYAQHTTTAAADRSLAPPFALAKVARRAGILPDRVCAEVLPGDKSSKIEELQASLFVSNSNTLETRDLLPHT